VPIHLAVTSADWYRYLVYLIEDEAFRKDVRGEAYRAVQKHHTYEANAAVWAEAWERAVARQAKIKAS
jgi:spore maturation protein CgeB